MTWLARRHTQELLDQVGAHPATEVEESYADLVLVNRLAGGRRALLGAVRDALRSLPDRQTLSVLDVGCGSGDLARVLLERLCGEGRAPSVVALDRHPVALALARRVHGARLALVRGDAGHLPFADGSFDVVTVSLFLHHVPDTALPAVLAELLRVSRGGLVVNDLERGLLAYVATWSALRLGTRNRLTRSDGPASVLAAFTPAELAARLKAAGGHDVVVRRRFPFRLIAIAQARPGPGSAATARPRDRTA